MKVTFHFSIVVDVSVVIPPPPPDLTVDVSGVPVAAKVGDPYSGTIKPAGGTPPYTFTLDAPLPDGLTLGTDGQITGTPTKDGTFDVSGSVTDSGA